MQELAEQRDALKKTVRATLENILEHVLTDLNCDLKELHAQRDIAHELQGKARLRFFTISVELTVNGKKSVVKIERTPVGRLGLFVNETEHVDLSDRGTNVRHEAYNMIDFYAHVTSCNILHNKIIENAETTVESEQKLAKEKLETDINKYNDMLNKLKGPAVECNI